MRLFIGGVLVHDEHKATDIERANKKVMHYYWQENILYFQNLMVPKLEDMSHIIEKMHNGIGHFGKARTFFDIKQWFFWHDRIDVVKEFVKACNKWQLGKRTNNLKSGIEGMKSISIYDLFYHVTLDITRPLPKTSSGNKYVLVAIDHYSKRCETRLVKEHDVITLVRFFIEEIICCFGVPKYIISNNGNEWMKEFDVLCQDYGIIHQFTT